MSDRIEKAKAFKAKFKETAKKTLTKKIMVGEHSVGREQSRPIGEKWTDDEGYEWEQKQGYQVKTGGNMVNKGLADKCKDCETLILQSWDKQIFKYNGRCYYCQIDFEAKLKGKEGRYEEWVDGKIKASKESFLKELENIFKEIEEEKLYDHSVANAIANDNVKQTIEKNKKLTGQ